MKKIIKTLVKIFAFVLILGACFFYIQSTLSSAADTKDAQRIYSFFEEEENSLDAVFLGSSTTYASWNSCVAWKEYGISSYTISNAAQPLFASKFMISDARKTQPHAVYLINVTHFLINYEAWLHKLLNSYPFTFNKLLMTGYLCDFADFTPSKTMEYFFPIIRFHDRWNELTLEDFNVEVGKDPYKSASYYSSYLKKARNIGAIQQDFTSYTELDEKTYNAMLDLMDYCKKDEVNVIFFVVPQSTSVKNSTERAGKQNATIKMLEEAGFDVLDLRKKIDEIGLDYQKDFYNDQHLNLHGSIKVTDYICKYLNEKYNFKDKRGTAGYEEWDQVTNDYYTYIKPYVKERDLPYLTIDIEQAQ